MLRRLLTVAITLCAPVHLAQAQTTQTLSIEQAIDKMTLTETALLERVKAMRPIVEAYIQESSNAGTGLVPFVDSYFLGRLEWRGRPTMAPMTDARRTEQGAGERRGFIRDGFAAMAAPDWTALNRARYEFRFVRREFLGEVRTLVFDVAHRKGLAAGFAGRIWVEDRDYHIVRYNGVNRAAKGPRFTKKVHLHMDGWRVHSGAGHWLPAYVHCEETGLEGQSQGHVVTSQVKLWGYRARSATESQAFASIQLTDAAVQDSSTPGQLTAVASRRQWEQEAEANVIERLERAGLLAPAGDVERVLDVLLNNLQAHNGIALEAPVKARVLLTTPLESFTVGHTLIVSRGLIDVLPDESSLAMVLAHELSHVVLGHPLVDTKWAFADRMMIDDAILLRSLAMARDPKDEAAADAKVIELLNNSPPYRDKLAAAGLFLRIIAERAARTPELIQPHLGDHISGQASRSPLLARAPLLKPADLTQVAALPIGARLVVDPWDGRLELLRTAAALPGSIREKAPLGITPQMPYLRYQSAAGTAAANAARPQ